MPANQNTSSSNRPLISATRQEVSVDLEVKEGAIPADWYGHVYITSPVGTVNSGGLPYPPGTQETGSPVMNGDGYFFRFDLGAGKVHLQTGLMRPPDYWADEATKQGNANGYGVLHHFYNMGITRLSLDLGARNLLNTAIVPFRFPGDPAPRLAACYDAGRPWEFDPAGLQLITAIGGNKEWTASTPDGLFPFPVVQASAHPTFDPVTKEFFFVNFTKDMQNLFPREALQFLFEKDPKELEQVFDQLVGTMEHLSDHNAILQEIGQRLAGLTAGTEHHALQWLSGILRHRQLHKSGTAQPPEVYLLRWKGENAPLDKWRVVDENGQPIDIQQCMHQTTLTEDYVILADATFKFTLDLLFNVPFSSPKLDTWLRRLLTTPQEPFLDIYIVKRSDLVKGQDSVRCRKLNPSIPLEAIHFTADYANPGGLITLHLAHNSASCLAEWVRRFDTLAPDGARPVDPEVISLISSGAMDIGRIGKVVIDAEKAVIASENYMAVEGNTDDPANVGAHTWTVGLHTFRDLISAEVAVPQIRHIYWSCDGLNPQLLTKFIYDLYYNYPNRTVPQSKMLELSQKGIPFVLARQNTVSMKLEDYYQFQYGQIMESIRFIPRRGQTPAALDPQMDGYILAMMLINYPNAGGNNYQCEVWVFDAAALLKGPVCKLVSPALDYAFTLHSAWTETAAPSRGAYHIDVKADYDPLIARLDLPALRRDDIQDLFNRFVYPQFGDKPTPLPWYQRLWLLVLHWIEQKLHW